MVGADGVRHPLYPCCSTEDVAMRNYHLNALWRSNVGSDHPFDLIDGTLRHEGEDNCPPRNIVPFAQRAFPPDTTAIIYRPARSAMTSGKANTWRWKLRFEQRATPFVEPLMGWTGGADPHPKSNWTSHPPRPQSPMPGGRASISWCRVLPRRRRPNAQGLTSRNLIRINRPPKSSIPNRAPAGLNGSNARSELGPRTTEPIS